MISGTVGVMERVIGIDFGARNCVSAVYCSGVRIIPAQEGEYMSTACAIDENGRAITGSDARDYLIKHPARGYINPIRELGSTVTLNIDGRELTPQEAAALVLVGIKCNASEHLCEPVKGAVITVPSYLGEAARRALFQAAEIAGLTIYRLISKPAAAAIALAPSPVILSVNIGCESMGAAVIRLDDELAQVVGCAGGESVEDSDYEKRLEEFIRTQVKKSCGIRHPDEVLCAKIKREAGEALTALGDLENVNINIPGLERRRRQADFHMNITSEMFSELTRDITDKMARLIKSALKDAGIGPGDEYSVVVDGTCSNIAAVADMISDLTGKEPRTGQFPGELFAKGAASIAAKYDASGAMADVAVMETVPMSVSSVSIGGFSKNIFKKNTEIPAEAKLIYTASRDDRSEMSLRVFQGEKRFAVDNSLMAQVVVGGVRESSDGDTQIELDFNIGVNGTCSVSAMDISGEELPVRVSYPGELEPRKVQEARHFASDYERSLFRCNEVRSLLAEAAELDECARRLLDKCRDTQRELYRQIRQERETLSALLETDEQCLSAQELRATLSQTGQRMKIYVCKIEEKLI
ncbi:MAG: Hsp70 family protein [Lachnospiraceae bacterium]|nr:Hsp70 family protein [Lachnospiraceae bacterium]